MDSQDDTMGMYTSLLSERVVVDEVWDDTQNYSPFGEQPIPNEIVTPLKVSIESDFRHCLLRRYRGVFQPSTFTLLKHRGGALIGLCTLCPSPYNTSLQIRHTNFPQGALM